MTEQDLDRFINDQSEKYVDQNPDTEEDDPRMSQNQKSYIQKAQLFGCVFSCMRDAIFRCPEL